MEEEIEIVDLGKKRKEHEAVNADTIRTFLEYQWKALMEATNILGKGMTLATGHLAQKAPDDAESEILDILPRLPNRPISLLNRF